jgi:ribosomal protein S18 acetylase RimI-like enzyme
MNDGINKITFRMAGISDASIMSELNTKNLPENYPLYYWIYQLSGFSSNSFLAFNGDHLVGYIFSFSTNQEQTIPTATICSLTVDPEYRKLGIASKLLDLAKNSYTAPIKLILHVNTKNENAIKLYKKKGYQISKLVPNYYNVNEDGYQMSNFKNF